MKYKIRKMKAEEYDLLNDFLYEAIFVPDGAKPPENQFFNCQSYRFIRMILAVPHMIEPLLQRQKGRLWERRGLAL